MIGALAAALLAAAAAPAAAPASPPPATPAAPPVPLTHYYPPEANAAAQLEGALAEARAGGRRAVLVFGADWCGDSRALAAILSSAMWQAEFGQRYNVVFIDVDHPTKGHGRNEALIARFGVKKMTGTPEMFVIGREGTALNPVADAMAWENAGDRPVGQIVKWFRQFP